MLENSFEKYNLRVLAYGFSKLDQKNDTVSFQVEIVTIEGNMIPCNLQCKLNLYDNTGAIIQTLNSSFLLKERFFCYDTITVWGYVSGYNPAMDIQRARLFIIPV